MHDLLVLAALVEPLITRVTQWGPRSSHCRVVWVIRAAGYQSHKKLFWERIIPTPILGIRQMLLETLANTTSGSANMEEFAILFSLNPASLGSYEVEFGRLAPLPPQVSSVEDAWERSDWRPRAGLLFISQELAAYAPPGAILEITSWVAVVIPRWAVSLITLITLIKKSRWTGTIDGLRTSAAWPLRF